jgi:phosphoglycerate dehydrogenase-like enzyme
VQSLDGKRLARLPEGVRIVVITPHVMAATPPESAAGVTASRIRTFDQGEVPDDIVDRATVF